MVDVGVGEPEKPLGQKQANKAVGYWSIFQEVHRGDAAQRQRDLVQTDSWQGPGMLLSRFVRDPEKSKPKPDLGPLGGKGAEVTS